MGDGNRLRGPNREGLRRPPTTSDTCEKTTKWFSTIVPARRVDRKVARKVDPGEGRWRKSSRVLYTSRSITHTREEEELYIKRSTDHYGAQFYHKIQYYTQRI